jgi:hypothetical protein
MTTQQGLARREPARLDGWVEDTLRDSVRSITVESIFFSTTMEDPFKPSTGGPGVASWARPAVTLNTAAGPIRLAPYGSPAAIRPIVQVVAFGVGVVGVLGILAWFLKKAKV